MSRTKAEAAARVQRAQQHVEAAQAQIGQACALISSLQHGYRDWQRLSRLYDRVHAEWYKLKKTLDKGRVDLDPMAAQTFLEKTHGA